MAKKKFKRVQITINEVENGFQVYVEWDFVNGSADCCNGDYNYGERHIAKTPEEALKIAGELYKTIRVTKDEEEE